MILNNWKVYFLFGADNIKKRGNNFLFFSINNMAKKKVGDIELDDFHYHEFLDRIHVVMDTIDSHVMQHPVCKIETEIKEIVNNAQDKLWEAYQVAGNIRFRD